MEEEERAKRLEELAKAVPYYERVAALQVGWIMD